MYRDAGGGDEALNPAGPHRQECLCHIVLRLCRKRCRVWHRHSCLCCFIRRRPSLKHAILFKRLAGFGNGEEDPVLIANDSPPLPVHLGHSSPSVIITGACEATYNSCPSREQITPG